MNKKRPVLAVREMGLFFCIPGAFEYNLTHSTAPSPAFEDGVEKRRSELALSEVEGVNPEQAQAFMLGSRRVDVE
jgi:hypothetical protein